jgi:hypothetical protein
LFGSEHIEIITLTGWNSGLPKSVIQLK